MPGHDRYMGYELIVDDSVWCANSKKEPACPRPTVTHHHGLASVEGINTGREVGLGSIWRCDDCGRYWMLNEHNTIGALIPTDSVEGASRWIAVND